MESGADRTYYLIESNSDSTIERIWRYCQYSGVSIPMYRTRITQYSIGWVIELDPANKISSLFLLEFAPYVTHISAPYYVRNSGATYYYQGTKDV